MAEDYLTLEETHALLRHIEKSTEKFANFLKQYPNDKEKSLPLVQERVDDILGALGYIKIGAEQVSMRAGRLATEIEQAGEPPVVVIPDDPTGHMDEDSTEQVIERAAQAAQEPAQGNGQPDATPVLRVRPAQARALENIWREGPWTPENSNEKRTADALVGKGLAFRSQNERNGKTALFLTDTGREWAQSALPGVSQGDAR